MGGSVAYSLALGLAFVIFCREAPQPGGSVVFWLAVAVHLSLAASVTWIRTRLPFATVAMSLGVVAAVLIAASAVSGHAFPLLPMEWAFPVYTLLLVAPVCLLIESRAHRREWEHWKAHMQHMSALDILRGRHVPDLRGDDRG
jgi:hypothetical protein